MWQFPWGGVKRMLNRKEVVESIQERMQALKSAEICALFLLSVKVEDIKEEDKKADNEKSIKEVAGVLAHFFRQTDIKGYLGNGLYVVFLTGNVTGSTIYEKTADLVQALRFASEDSWNGEVEVLAGVLLSSLKKGSYRYMFRKADYALEMARKDEKNHFYIYAEPDTQEELKQGLAAPSSSQMMFHYIDEGVRIIEAGDILRTVYVSPGFYRRLSLDNQQAKKALIQIHPDDIDDYEKHVWETARSGEPGNSCYRVSLDGQNWISCRVRLLRIWAGNGERKPIIIEISHNTSGLERLKGQLDEVHIIYTNMINAAASETSTMQLLPLKKISFNRPMDQIAMANVRQEEIMLSPSAESVLDSIIPNYVVGTIYGCLVESYCSEHNSRMMAMQSSTDNAKEMLRTLSIEYNRARQAAITQEITEVIGGVRAQKGKH